MTINTEIKSQDIVTERNQESNFGRQMGNKAQANYRSNQHIQTFDLVGKKDTNSSRSFSPFKQNRNHNTIEKSTPGRHSS